MWAREIEEHDALDQFVFISWQDANVVRQTMSGEEEVAVECPLVRAVGIGDGSDQFGDLFFVVLNNADRAHSKENHLAPAWIVQVLLDKGASIFAQLYSSGREIFFKSEMQEPVAFLASLS